MIPDWLQRPVLLLALMASALLQPSAESKPELAPGDISLTGQLLIATADNGDPRFDHAVILVVRHKRAGALGISINHPLEERPLASLLAEMGADATGVSGSVLLFAGGPVEPEAGFVLHSTEYRRPETLDIDGRVALTGAPDVLRDIGLGKGPNKSLVAFGYSGWGPAQLENELTQGVWMTVAEDPTLVFDADRAEVWTEALALYKSGR